ncbi:fibronectin type III domain-containing protein-like [Acropora muricata]|uniref:fibronectin type III domain-containing protein-like n=1 Tax=Acropora muricata TaxID=159855 RepID=UPI0034E3DA26
MSFALFCVLFGILVCFPETGTSSAPSTTEPTSAETDAGKRVTTPIYKTAWFVALALIALLLLLGTIIFICYTRRSGRKYHVGKREKMRAAPIEDEELSDQRGGPQIDPRRSEQPPKYKSDSSLHRDSDRDSWDDYIEGESHEHGSFIQEYGDDKTKTQGVTDQYWLSTYV